MLDIARKEFARYVYQLRPSLDPVLVDMEALAKEKRFPIVGPLVGQLIEALTYLQQSRCVFEMGSGYGYSAYWFARAMPADGQVICTGSAKGAERARQFLARAQLAHKLRYEVGDALEVIDRIPGDFDAILIDIDKHQYPEAWRKASKRVRVGGLIITDNLLRFGFEQDHTPLHDDPDPGAQGLKEFARLAYADPNFCTTIVTVRDGVGLSVRVA